MFLIVLTLRFLSYGNRLPWILAFCRLSRKGWLRFYLGCLSQADQRGRPDWAEKVRLSEASGFRYLNVYFTKAE